MRDKVIKEEENCLINYEYKLLNYGIWLQENTKLKSIAKMKGLQLHGASWVRMGSLPVKHRVWYTRVVDWCGLYMDR